jgi:hypothetical protein
MSKCKVIINLLGTLKEESSEKYISDDMTSAAVETLHATEYTCVSPIASSVRMFEETDILWTCIRISVN